MTGRVKNQVQDSCDGLVDKYIRDIIKIPRLTAEEEADLSRRIFESGYEVFMVAYSADSDSVRGYFSQKAHKGAADKVFKVFEQSPLPESLDQGNLRNYLQNLSCKDLTKLLDDFSASYLAGLSRAGLEMPAGMEAKISERNEAANKMVVHNLKLAFHFAKKTGSGKSLMDRIQDANEALLKVATYFDYRSGCRFSTYARHEILGSINAGIKRRRTIRLTTQIYQRYNMVKRALVRLKLEKGEQEFPPEEIAKKVFELYDIEKRLEDKGFSQEEVNERIEKEWETIIRSIHNKNVIYETSLVSLDGWVVKGVDQKGCKTPRISFIEDRNLATPEEFVSSLQTHEMIPKFLDEVLTSREEDVIRRRFGIGYDDTQNSREIAEIYEVSRQRIEQIERAALKKLREPLKQLQI